MSPEIIVDQEFCYNHKVDIWALGIIAYEILADQKSPFSTIKKDNKKLTVKN